MQDRTDWLKTIITQINEAADDGNSKEVSRLVKRLTGKAAFSTKRPANDKDGKPLRTVQEQADFMADFAATKFSATEREVEREPWPELEVGTRMAWEASTAPRDGE